MEDHALTIQQIYEIGLNEGSLAYRLGFPMNLVDVIKAPVCRRGCIFRFYGTVIRQNGYPTFLIDAQSFPGDSGGPVVNRPEHVALVNTPSNTRANLIGILSGHIPYEEVLISTRKPAKSG